MMVMKVQGVKKQKDKNTFWMSLREMEQQQLHDHWVIYKTGETLTLTQGQLYLSGSVVGC